MKIYTRKGDDGSTGLASGERVAKHDPRVDMYGTADELNSVIGLAVASLSDEARPEGPEVQGLAPIAGELVEDLVAQQSLLFELGSELAGFLGLGDKGAVFSEDVALLEKRIDAYDEQLEPMKSFVLPGGTPTAATLHIARTVCRRLERVMTAAPADMVRDIALQYVNRLSDYLFTAARLANRLAGHADVPWQSRARARD